MPIFRDSEHLYGVLDAFFSRMREQEAVASALLAGKFVLRFRYKEPEGQVTVDLRGDQLSWQLGEVDLEPDLEMIQRADIAHRFWMGKLSVPRALATRQVVSRGDVAKALKLLPALKPAYPLYATVLEELGESELLHALDEPAAANGGVFRKLRGALSRRLLPRNLHVRWAGVGADGGQDARGRWTWHGSSALAEPRGVAHGHPGSHRDGASDSLRRKGNAQGGHPLQQPRRVL